MPSEIILHALGLHFHQPTDALHRLLRQDAGELRRILLCYERLARHAHKYAAVARLHVVFSGVLLAQLRDPAFIEASRHLADVPALLDSLRSAPNIEFIGCGQYHAPLPLIPPEDWDEQLRSERLAMESGLGRMLKGYFPPAALFTPELIPALLRAGYEYVLLSHATLVLPDGSRADPYRAYRLRHGKAVINVVPWDRGFSQAQESGLDAAWFADETRNGVALSPPSACPYLLTTWSDGDAGEWFRRMDEEHGFFGHFFSPSMEFCETGEFPVRPVHLSEHLHRYPPTTEVTLAPEMQTAVMLGNLAEDALLARQKLFAVVKRYWSLVRSDTPAACPSRAVLLQVRELTLRAEQSSLLLGDATQRAGLLDLLDMAEKLLASTAPQADQPALANALPLPAPTPLAEVPKVAERILPESLLPIVNSDKSIQVKAEQPVPKRSAKNKLRRK